MTLGRIGTVRSLETTGLDFSENDSQSWTIAPVVDIELPLAYRRGGIVMDIEATPFIFPDVVLLYQPAETMTHWPCNLVPRAGSGDSVSAGESELPRSGEIDPQASRTFGRGSRGHVVVSCRITC